MTAHPLADDVAICVLSFDGAQDLWVPFFDFFSQAWPDCPLPVYLVTNHKSYEGPVPVTSLPIGEDVDWSSNLLKALDMIPQGRVLFIFDDFFPRSIKVDMVLKHAQTAIDQNWPYLTLYPNNHRKQTVLPGIQQIGDHGVYRCTLVYGLYTKDALRDLLVPGENAWEFEIESGIRARAMPLYSVQKPVFRHYHLLRKGKWMQPGFDVVAARYNIQGGRPVETRMEYILRETKEWLFRKYHRHMPPGLIERRENRRKKS